MLPIFAFPAFVAGLAGTGNGVEAPSLFAAVRFKGSDEAANAIFAAGQADDHFVFHHERRHGHGITRGRVSELVIPNRVAVPGIQGDQVRVHGGHEQRVAKDGHAAVHDSATRARIGRGRVVINPKHAAALGVNRDHIVGRLREVHDPIDNQRSGLEFLQRLRLKHPLQLEILDVCGVDLLERAIALAHVAAGVGQPVLRFAGRAQQAVGSDLSQEGAG